MRDMSQETLSRFRPQERLEFPPYLENQLVDILKERVKEAFRENAVSDDEKLVLLALTRHLKRGKEAIFLPPENVESSCRVSDSA